MKPTIIPTVIVTNQENPMTFYADALGITLYTLRRLVLRGLIRVRTDGRTNTLRVTDAGRTAIRNVHADNADREALELPTPRTTLDRKLHALADELANKGVIEFSTDLNKG